MTTLFVRLPLTGAYAVFGWTFLLLHAGRTCSRILPLHDLHHDTSSGNGWSLVRANVEWLEELNKHHGRGDI